MTLFDQLCSRKNLELAWRRIGTGTSQAYKRFFRHLYNPYEIGLMQNLDDLHKRLKGGSYLPQTPTRVYTPKPSGLQRPITLLSLEDQIVWQAVANIFARKLRRRRKSLELDAVFSNILCPGDDKFYFIEDWHRPYNLFQKKVKRYYSSGFRWIAHFDLAAFYDTICHDLLLRIIVQGRGANRFVSQVSMWLEKWSSGHDAGNHKHGIPQGPNASAFLADCFMLSIDKVLHRGFNYLRYCDDIRLFAKTEEEAMQAAIRLEVLCREQGLIPQGKKRAIKLAKSVKDAMGSLPSIGPPADQSIEPVPRLPVIKAMALLRSALTTTKPLRIADKSRVRHVLFNAGRSSKLLGYVVKLLPHHPEHIDAFTHYISHFKRSKRIIRLCRDHIRTSPYEYVQGELWHILARMMTPTEMERLVKFARMISIDDTKCFMLKWGVCHFLCNAEQTGLGSQSRYLRRQENPLLTSLIVPVLPDSQYLPKGMVSKILTSRAYEPSMALALQMVQRNLVCKDYNVRSSALAAQSRNVFRKIGLVRGRRHVIDPMGEIMERRFGIAQWDGWRRLFADEYSHALRILVAGDSVYDSARSEWLKYQNSFNDALFRALQNFVTKRGLLGIMKLCNKNGRIIDFGVLLDPNKVFSKKYPQICDPLRTCNKRRHDLPGSHPYNVKGQKTQWLGERDQGRLLRTLKSAYEEIMHMLG